MAESSDYNTKSNLNLNMLETALIKIEGNHFQKSIFDKNIPVKKWLDVFDTKKKLYNVVIFDYDNSLRIKTMVNYNNGDIIEPIRVTSLDYFRKLESTFLYSIDSIGLPLCRRISNSNNVQFHDITPLDNDCRYFYQDVIQSSSEKELFNSIKAINLASNELNLELQTYNKRKDDINAFLEDNKRFRDKIKT